MPVSSMSRHPARRFDWNLRSCGLHGHVTYAPTEENLAVRLSAPTSAGIAWRCLRCDTFVPGEPAATGPADEAPLVLRGKALKDAAILRILALERGARALLLFALAYGIHRFDNAKDSLDRTLATYLPLLKPVADRAHVDLADSGPVKLIEKAVHYQHTTLEWVIIGVVAYALLQLAEATGLWLMKRWGEYVAVVGTSAGLPLEIHEVIDQITAVRVVLLVVNIAAVVYLIWSKRLFGVRGGHAAFEAERHSESLLEVERVALVADTTPTELPHNAPTSGPPTERATSSA